MGAIAGIVVLLAGLMLQTAVFSRLTLMSGAADVVLLLLIAWAMRKQTREWELWFWTVFGAVFTAFISAVPPLITLGLYVGIIFVSRWMRNRIWQGEVLAYFFSVLLGTVIQHGVTFAVLRFFSGIALELETSVVYVILPSLVLNLLFAFPIYLLMKDLSDWIYPGEVDSYV
ncbi:MAG: hypothetical protein HPY85_01155 [Anaerolineae bacterium]|jgi:hypothetical protein|nr:hypothetical protein [Anaerolineae bacterium]